MPDAADTNMPSGKVTVSQNALMEDLGGEAIILNLNNERYYGLDKVSLDFWNWIRELGDVDLVLQRANDAYETDEATIRKDLGVFLLELSNAGLISFDDEKSG